MFQFKKLTLLPATFAAALCFLTVTLAEEAEPVRIRGTLIEMSADHMKIHARDGNDIEVGLSKDAPIFGVALTDLSAIKPDSYIGTAAAPQSDGTLKALEVHVFPSSMRGAGEGSRPWDLTPNSTMTNGAVGSILGTEGRTLTVKYKDGEKKVVVPADVPIVSLEPGDTSLLMTGAKVLVLAARGKDGSQTAVFIGVGKNGITPPM
ncbi:hypothetical protein CO662_22905 [Rhizobium anhuiense]|uniref:DUF5666 domain-containing protein n=1 Tax=Rhizobium anhuiense TaxID=1184720 RepID=A0ABX4J388_9HYPH|nr:hypothetical protein [Rhizobium anhuiense]PDS41185.1 hypothetical protein CO668_30025 [Rhizobium anhuiense]PDS49645.1 hypothetical protein CO662_22905 [Rhizobium anhuiense]